MARTKKYSPSGNTKTADYKDYSIRYRLLELLGAETQDRYNKNLLYGAGSYNLSKLQGTLKFIPDLKNFKNDYYLEGDTEEQTKVAKYFEYGTGLFNTRTKADYIRPVNAPMMVWKDKHTGKMIFAKKTKGVKPVFAMTKAIKSVDMDMEVLLPRLMRYIQ